MAKTPKKASRAPAGDKPKACYVLSLSVENVRCFGPKQTLDLSNGHGRPAQWTIILGENGTGKTTLLQGIAGFEETFLKHMRNGKYATDYPDARLYQKMSPVFWKRGGRDPAAGSGVVVRYTSSTFSVLDPVGPEYAASVTFGEDFGEYKYLDSQHAPPICAAYGASRRLGVPSFVADGFDDPIATLFSDIAPLRNASDWLVRLDYGSMRKDSGQQRYRDRLTQVREMLTSGVLPGITDLRFATVDPIYPTARVEFRHEHFGWVPLRQLGYGYQTLIAWMLDFVSRMVERYPDSDDPLGEPAICVVDEIDLHLHPKWQRELIGFLSERFPNTQFIATAHSPLVVQAAENANIAVLKREGDHVVIDNDVDNIRNWRVDQILTSDLFGLESARSPEVEKLFKRQEQLAVKARPTRAEKQELKDIQAKIDQLPTWAGLDERRELETIRTILERLDRTSPK